MINFRFFSQKILPLEKFGTLLTIIIINNISKTMKILAISDIHGNTDILPALGKLIKAEKNLSFIAFSGDVVEAECRGREWYLSLSENRRPNRDATGVIEEEAKDRSQHEAFYTFLAKQNIPSFMVPGNMDSPEKRLMSFIDRIGESANSPINFIHRNTISMEGFTISGFGGGIGEKKETYFQLIYPAETVRFGFRKIKYIAGRKIILFHIPPHGILDRYGEAHLGHKVINDIIEDVMPELVICGHAHEHRGCETLGSTSIVNPGALKDGSAAIIDLNREKVRFLDL